MQSGAQKDKPEQSGQEVFNVALDYTFNLKIAGFDWESVYPARNAAASY